MFIVSASIGGGHDGAAAELARRLEISGVHTLTVDFLDLLPIGLGWLIRSIYSFQLRFVPQSYEALYRFCMIVRFSWRPTVAISTVLSRRRLLRRLREFNPSVVVSVYPLASLALGRMRTKRWLNVAAVTYLTDFSVHPLWLHPGVTVTPHAAALTEPRTAVARIAEQVERVRRGETPRNLVDLNAGY